MTVKQEDVKDVPLVYPLVAVRLRTVAIVNGRRIDNECEEILNLDQIDARDYNAVLGRLLREFESYVSKVVETANSPEGRRELQSILDQHERPAPQPSADPPSSPPAAAPQGAGTAPSDLPEV